MQFKSRGAILQTSNAILSQEAGAALEAETGAEEDPELWDQDEDEAEEMADFEEAHAPGGPPVGARHTRKAPTERAPLTPPQQKKTRTTEPEALAKGGAPLSQVQLFNHESHAESQGHGIRRFRNEHARPSQPWQVPEILLPCHLHSGLVLVPLTTLDSPMKQSQV